MEATVVNSLPDSEYIAVFKRYIVKRTEIVLVRVQQADPILSSNILKQALHILDYSLELPEAWPKTRQLLLAMAPKMEQDGYRDEWMPYLEQGIQQSRQLADTATQAELQVQLGILYQLRSKYQEARTHLETSIREFERLNARRNQARALNRLAQVVQRQRQFEEATTLVEAALQILGEKDPERAFSYFVLALIAIDKRAWPEAAEWCRKSLSLWEQQNDRRMMGRSLTILGDALESMKRYAEAITVYERAIALLEEVHDPVHQAMAQMNLGTVYLWREHPRQALEVCRPTERIFRQVQDRLHLAHVNHNIGLAYRQLQEWDEAEAAYLLSIEQYQKVGNMAWLVNSMDGLGLVYLEQGQLAAAKKTFEEARKCLAQLEGEPRYEHLLKMVTVHLQETFDRMAHQ